MIEFFQDAFQYRFIQHAMAAGLLASIVCGLIGVIIVEKRLVMMSGGIAHTAYGGVGLGFLLGFEPILGAFLFAILAAFGIGFIKRKGGTGSDVVIGLFWSAGMASGIFFVALMPGYPPDMSSYLFGNILSATASDVRLMAVLTIVVVLTVIGLFNNWKAWMFDGEFATILGVNTGFLEYLMMLLIAMTIVVLIRVVGIILALALLTAPAAIAALLVPGLKARMVWATGIGTVITLTGLWLSYGRNLASGATIVMLSVACFLVVYVGKTMISKRNQG